MLKHFTYLFNCEAYRHATVCSLRMLRVLHKPDKHIHFHVKIIAKREVLTFDSFRIT